MTAIDIVQQEKFEKIEEKREEKLSVSPFLKWVGGKRQLLNRLVPLVPKEYGRYFEPFVGGGALFFCLLPNRATISDINEELINCYRVIRDDVELLIEDLAKHKNEPDYFYAMRDQSLMGLTSIQRASRFIYLNKTCYNGLYRENKKGKFNVPFGAYANPKIVDAENLRAVSRYLKSADIDIQCRSFEYVLEESNEGDFVYFDPPYAPSSDTANFVQYSKGGFGLDDQKRLAEVVHELTNKGVKVMLSNSNMEIVHQLYGRYTIQIVHATRAVSCKGESRGKAAHEVIVTNY